LFVHNGVLVTLVPAPFQCMYTNVWPSGKCCIMWPSSGLKLAGSVLDHNGANWLTHCHGIIYQKHWVLYKYIIMKSQERMHFGGLNKVLVCTKGITASAGYMHLNKHCTLHSLYSVSLLNYSITIC